VTVSTTDPRLRRPRLTLVIAAVCIAALGGLGLGVEHQLRPTSLSIAGTSSARGEALARRHFGDSVPFVILLRGPAAALERQGPRLVAAVKASARRRGNITLGRRLFARPADRTRPRSRPC
jgi:hypothetical protein